MQPRHTKILDILSRQSSATVAELSRALATSEVTIRKDLSLLEKQGFLQRGHGFATLQPSDDIANRLAFHYDIKQRIAQAALESVEDGETVFIESGSCCVLLAEALASQKREVTIITNSAFLADYIRKRPEARVILLGGDYQKESQVMVGPILRRCVEDFYVDKLFVGIDGAYAGGVMGNNLARAEAVRAMAEHARKAIVLTESLKFERPGVVSLFPLDQLYAVYTDDRLGAEARQSLAEKDVKLVTVPVGEA